MTPDEAGLPDAIEFDLRLNGELMQEGTTADLVHSIPALVAYLSMLMTLRAGRHRLDRHARGRRQPARPARVARSGDEVVISSAWLGVLETTLA